MARAGLRTLFKTRNRALAKEIASLERAADLPSTILILGESGTGKDRLARAVHDVSSRVSRPFVRIDAANLSDDLFESELFGHERGAFTGAVSAKKGLLEVAEDGTVYLDEVSSLSPAAQAKFLRVLQEKTFRRLAGSVTHPFRGRMIVSSRRDLAGLVSQGAFRDDFFYRIDVVSVRLPRLRERPEDVLPLARAFARRAARAWDRPARRFTDAAEKTLQRHPWPGNVRELRNVIERLLLLTDDVVDGATARQILAGRHGSAGGASELSGPLADRVSAFEREVVLAELQAHGYNVAETARALGLERSHFYKKCQQLGIDVKAERSHA